ncbi:MAG: DUF86 domain-containing protein [Planctomycetota bacterium]
MWRDDAYLLDILIAARRALEFSRGLTWEQFDQSHLHQAAIVRTLEIIGEAAGRLSKEIKAAHPEIPWDGMIGMRNRLIHEYFRVDLAKVWDVVQNEVPVLIRLISPLVPPDDEVSSS